MTINKESVLINAGNPAGFFLTTMKFNFYSIYDRLLGVYLTPFPGRADVEATRSIVNTLRDPQSRTLPIATNPGDYDLVCLGTFDDESGQIETAKPRLLVNLRALVADESAVKTPPPAPEHPGLDDHVES